jgi:hypothetical protein
MLFPARFCGMLNILTFFSTFIARYRRLPRRARNLPFLFFSRRLKLSRRYLHLHSHCFFSSRNSRKVHRLHKTPKSRRIKTSSSMQSTQFSRQNTKSKVSSLRELASRVVIRDHLDIEPGSLPLELKQYISQSRLCGFCQNCFVEAISEHVYLIGSEDNEVCKKFKFLFKLNKYLPSNLPIIFPLCSFNCVLKFPPLVGLAVVKNKKECN